MSASVHNFKVNNVVGSASLGFRVDLAACYADNQAGARARARRQTCAGHLQLQPDKLLWSAVPLLAEEAAGTRRGASRSLCSSSARLQHAATEDEDQDSDQPPPTISFAVFESGKMVLTGAREYQDLVDAFEASKHVFFLYQAK